MVNISRMAKAAGIGSAVGATIGGIKEARDKDGDVLGGIVGGAFVGSIGGAGISVGKQALKNKLIAKAYDQNISDSVMAEAEKVYAKHGMPDSTNDLKVAKQISKAQKPAQSNVINNAQDLDIAKQVSKATAGNTAPIQTKPVHVNSTQNGTIEKLIDDYYGPGTSADEYVRNKLNKNFTETKTFRKWHIGDPYSDGEIGTDLEIRQRKSNGVFEIKEHPFFIDDPEYYYSEPNKWTPYKFS